MIVDETDTAYANPAETHSTEALEISLAHRAYGNTRRLNSGADTRARNRWAMKVVWKIRLH